MKLNAMGKYVIDINEKSSRGKAFKAFLESDPEIKMVNLDKVEDLEDRLVAAQVRKAKKTKLLSYEEGKAEFQKIRRRFKK